MDRVCPQLPDHCCYRPTFATATRSGDMHALPFFSCTTAIGTFLIVTGPAPVYQPGQIVWLPSKDVPSMLQWSIPNWNHNQSLCCQTVTYKVHENPFHFSCLPVKNCVYQHFNLAHRPAFIPHSALSCHPLFPLCPQASPVGTLISPSSFTKI